MSYRVDVFGEKIRSEDPGDRNVVFYRLERELGRIEGSILGDG
jgi:hypothetical protein